MQWTRRWTTGWIAAGGVILAVGVAHAQRGSGDWVTSANDAQRSSWVRSDGKISLAAMRKPGFSLLWKVKADNQSRQMEALTPPALMDFYIGYRGFRTLSFTGASSDKVIALDTDISRKEWEKALANTPASDGPAGCPGGMTSAVTRPTQTAYPPLPRSAGAGRGSWARSGVGEPHQGSVILQAKEREAARRAAAAPPPPPKPVAGAKPAAPSPFAPHVEYVMAVSGDGKLHSMYVSNGFEAQPAVDFIPAGARAHGLVVYDGTAYIATTGNCGGADNGVWALDLESKQVKHWKSQKGVSGNAGPAVGPDGTLYAASGNELVALSPKTLEPVAIFKSESPLSSTPVVFEFKGKNLIAVPSEDGKLSVLDTASLTNAKPLAQSAAFASPGYTTGSLASWQDPSGTRWILAAALGDAATRAGFPVSNGSVRSGAIVAWKVVEKDGGIALEPGWISRDMQSPLPPIIINGVIFAVAGGEFQPGDNKLTVAERVKRSSPAILYALDSGNGKELWSSGNSIESFVHSGGLAAGGSRIYVSTHDNIQYAFGMGIEH